MRLIAEKIIWEASTCLITGTNSVDHLWGTIDDDWIDGSDENDILYGGLGSDWLYGGDGNDILFGERATIFYH